MPSCTRNPLTVSSGRAIRHVPRVYVRNRVAAAYNAEQLEAETCVAPALYSLYAALFLASANTAHSSMLCTSCNLFSALTNCQTLSCYKGHSLSTD